MSKSLQDIAGEAAALVIAELNKLGVPVGGTVVVIQIDNENAWAMAGNIHPSILIPNTLIALTEVEEGDGSGTIH